ncbi:MAG: hypothetical protein CL920_25370 [Deltaproteobacteria bacterium]|nr:hypothetical protein [Deltaproteobacteria bacterium]
MSQSNTSQTEKKKRKKRGFFGWMWRIFVWLLGGVALLPVLLIVGWQIGFVRGIISNIGLSVAGGFLEGSLEAELGGNLLSSLEVNNVKWLDREKKPMVALKGLRVRYDLMHFISSGFTDLLVTEVKITKPKAVLKMTKKGINLLNHIKSGPPAPKKPKPKPKPAPSGPSNFKIRVPNIQIDGLDLQFTQGKMFIHVKDFETDVAFAMLGSRLEAEVKKFQLAVNNIIAPKKPDIELKRLTLKFWMELNKGELGVRDLLLKLAQKTQINIPSLLMKLAGPEFHFDNMKLFVASSDLQNILPTYPVKPDLNATISVHGALDGLKAKLDASLGKLLLKLKADAGVLSQSFDVDLDVKHADGAEIMGNPALKSSASLHAIVKGKGFSPANMKADVKLHVGKGYFQQYTFDRVDLIAKIHKSFMTLYKLEVRTPYAKIDMPKTGQVDYLKGSMDVILKGVVADLRKVGRLIKQKMSGYVSFWAHAKAKAEFNPSAKLKVRIRRFRHPSARVRKADLTAQLVGIKPVHAVVQSLVARGIRAGGQSIRVVKLGVTYKMPGDGLCRLRRYTKRIWKLPQRGLWMTYRMPNGGHCVQLSKLEFDMGMGYFKLRTIPNVVMHGQDITISRLLLASRRQQIDIAGRMNLKGMRPNLTVKIKKINLAKVQKALKLMPKQKIAGLFSLDLLRFSGSLRRPKIFVNMHLANGRFDKYHPIDLGLKLDYKDRRLVLERLSVKKGNEQLVKMGTDIPVHLNLQRFPKQPVGLKKPLSVKLDIPGFDLTWLKKTLGLPVRGKLKMKVHVDKTLSKPQLYAKIALLKGGYGDIQNLDLNLLVRYRNGILRFPGDDVTQRASWLEGAENRIKPVRGERFTYRSTNWIARDGRPLVRLDGVIPFRFRMLERRGALKPVYNINVRKDMKFSMRIYEQSFQETLELYLKGKREQRRDVRPSGPLYKESLRVIKMWRKLKKRVPRSRRGQKLRAKWRAVEGELRLTKRFRKEIMEVYKYRRDILAIYRHEKGNRKIRDLIQTYQKQHQSKADPKKKGLSAHRDKASLDAYRRFQGEIASLQKSGKIQPHQIKLKKRLEYLVVSTLRDRDAQKERRRNRKKKRKPKRPKRFTMSAKRINNGLRKLLYTELSMTPRRIKHKEVQYLKGLQRSLSSMSKNAAEMRNHVNNRSAYKRERKAFVKDLKALEKRVAKVQGAINQLLLLGHVKGRFHGLIKLSGNASQPQLDVTFDVKKASFCPLQGSAPRCEEKWSRYARKRRTLGTWHVRDANFHLGVFYRPKGQTLPASLKKDADIPGPGGKKISLAAFTKKTGRLAIRSYMKVGSLTLLRIFNTRLAVDVKIHPTKLSPKIRVHDPIEFHLDMPDILLDNSDSARARSSITRMYRNATLARVQGKMMLRVDMSKKLSQPDFHLAFLLKDGQYEMGKNEEDETIHIDDINMSLGVDIGKNQRGVQSQKRQLLSVKHDLSVFGHPLMSNRTSFDLTFGIHADRLFGSSSRRKKKKGVYTFVPGSAFQALVEFKDFPFELFHQLGGIYKSLEGRLKGRLNMQGHFACPAFQDPSYISLRDIRLGMFNEPRMKNFAAWRKSFVKKFAPIWKQKMQTASHKRLKKHFRASVSCANEVALHQFRRRNKLKSSPTLRFKDFRIDFQTLQKEKGKTKIKLSMKRCIRRRLVSRLRKKLKRGYVWGYKGMLTGVVKAWVPLTWSLWSSLSSKKTIPPECGWTKGDLKVTKKKVEPSDLRALKVNISTGIGGLPLNFVESFVDGVQMKGALKMSLLISGTMKKPSIKAGRVGFEFDRLRYTPYGVEIRNNKKKFYIRKANTEGKEKLSRKDFKVAYKWTRSKLFLLLKPNKYEVDGQLLGKKGTPLKITGTIPHKQFVPQRVSLAIRSKDFQPMATPRYKLTLDTNIKIRKQLVGAGSKKNRKPDVKGYIRIPRMLFTLPESSHKPGDFSQDEDIVVLGEKGYRKKLYGKDALGKDFVEFSEGPSSLDNLWVDLKLIIPNNFFVKNRDLSVEAKTDEEVDNLHILLKDGRLKLTGGIKLVRGELQAYGKQFLIDSSSQVRFSGQSLRMSEIGYINPSMNIVANYVINVAKGSLMERKGHKKIIVSLVVKGTVQNYEIDFVVRDAQSNDKLNVDKVNAISLILTGSTTEDLSQGQQKNLANQAVGMVSKAVSSEIKNALSGVLPTDVLNIEAGTKLTDLQVGFGWYLTPELYTGVNFKPVPLDEENLWEAHINYAISRNWSLEGRIGQVKRNDELLPLGSLYVFFRLKFW